MRSEESAKQSRGPMDKNDGRNFRRRIGLNYRFNTAPVVAKY
jgi:hypothetical protein